MRTIHAGLTYTALAFDGLIMESVTMLTAKWRFTQTHKIMYMIESRVENFLFLGFHND